MVAPVQGSIGKSSAAPETQDYLNELTNFYNKPENEGVESEFVSPDGSKFKITDASYLSTVRSNVNTGKFDGANADNKSVSKDADTQIGSYAADKKAKAEKQGDSQGDASAKANSDNAMSQGDNFMKSGTKPLESASKQQDSIASKIKSNQAETSKNTAESKQTFEQMDQNAKQMETISKQTTAKTNQNFKKAQKIRKEKIKAKAEKAAEKALEADSTTQSGSKMGFEGKLMTTAGASTGGNAGNDAAMQKAWEDTMNGKINVSNKAIQSEEPKLANVKDAGEKAAQPALDQAKMSEDAAGEASDQKKDTIEGGVVNVGIDVVMLAIGIITTTVAANATPFAVAALLSGIVSILTSLVKGIVDTKTSCDTADGQQKQIDANNKAAEEQKSQSMTARKNAIVQTQASNAKLIQANQNLNKVSQECSSDLSSSEMSAINTDGMDKDQLETVKKDRYNQIMQHEQAHAAIIGGSPVIETDANGVAIGGYVQIDVPSVDEADLEGTIEKAQRVIDAALAPSDPSSQDQNVASQAKDVLSKAQDLLAEKTEKADKEDEKKPEEAKNEEKIETKANEVKPELQTKAA